MPTLPLLKKGDRIALVATARKVSPDEVATALRLFQSWGLDTLVPEGLFASDNQFAGSDAHRAALLQQLLDDPSVSALVCCRGGYGTVRIIDRLDFTAFRTHPKWIVGYSDVTVLHSHLSRQCALPSLHAIMPLNITPQALTSPAVTTLRRFLFEGRLDYHFTSDPARRTVANRTGTASAPVVGGNLSILYSLLGSPSDIDTDGKILFIEDLDEYLYHIDRMLMALRRAGKLAHLKGLIVGAMSDMHDNTIPFGRDAETIIRDAVADYHYPVAFYAPFGHIEGQNHALPLGIEAHMEVNEHQFSISF